MMAVCQLTLSCASASAVRSQGAYYPVTRSQHAVKQPPQHRPKGHRAVGSPTPRTVYVAPPYPHLQGNQPNFNPAPNVNQGQGRNCNRVPASSAFNISDESYYFPENNINQELTERKDVLEKIFEEGRKITRPDPETETSVLYTQLPSDFQSSVGDAVKKSSSDDREGCASYRLLLRSFNSFGGHCWVVYPRHQDISYVKCGAPQCGGACDIEEKTVGVWAWCSTLPYGKRISKISLPLPVSCKCRVFNC